MELLLGRVNDRNLVRNSASEGTVRKLYAESIERNAIHGSDAPETAAEELKYFFNSIELNQR